MALALYTNRTLLVDYPDWSKYFHTDLNFDYHKNRAIIPLNNTFVSLCPSPPVHCVGPAVRSWKEYINGDFLQMHEDVLVINYDSSYAIPLIQANLRMSKWMNRYFPTGEVFYPIFNVAFGPSEIVLNDMNRYTAQLRKR
jgi:hypothetical protein